MPTRPAPRKRAPASVSCARPRPAVGRPRTAGRSTKAATPTIRSTPASSFCWIVKTRRSRPPRLPFSGASRRAQRQDRHLWRDADSDGGSGGAEAGVHVEGGVAFAIEAQIKAVRQPRETDETREKGQRDLAAVRVAGEDEIR